MSAPFWIPNSHSPLGYLSDAAVALLNLCALYSSLLTIIAVHEIGHLIAASICKFPVQEFRVGPFQWLSSSGWHVIWTARTPVSGIVRIKMMGNRKLEMRCLSLTLAGPVANFVAGTVGMLFLARVLTPNTAGLVRLWSVASVITGSINLLPFRSTLGRSDGLRVLNIRRDLPRMRFAAAFLDSQESLKEALRSKDFVHAKQIAQDLLALTENISDTTKISKMLKALRTILAEPGINVNERAQMSQPDPEKEPSIRTAVESDRTY